MVNEIIRKIHKNYWNYFYYFLVIKIIILWLWFFIISEYILFYIHIWYNSYFWIPLNYINIWEYDSYVVNYDIIRQIILFIIWSYSAIYLFFKLLFKWNSKYNTLNIFLYLSPFILVQIEDYIINWLRIPDKNLFLYHLSILIFYLLYFLLNKDSKFFNTKNYWINIYITIFILWFTIIHSHNLLKSYWKKIATNTAKDNNYLNYNLNWNYYIIFWWNDNYTMVKKVINNKLSNWVFFIDNKKLEWLEIKKWWIVVDIDKN